MFEGFDDVAVPDQWDEITNRAAGPGGPAFEPGHGHRIAFLVAAAAAVVGLAGVLWVGLADGDDLATVNTPADTVPESTSPVTAVAATTAPPTTIEVAKPPATSSPPATSPMTTASGTSAPVTSASTVPPFECNEITGDPDRVYEDDPALAHFGPMGAAPTLDITVDTSAILEPYTDVTRVPGGTAILFQSQWPQTTSFAWSVIVVNDDGTLRWRRCGSDAPVYSVLGAAHSVIVSGQDQSLRLLDVSTGEDAGILDIPHELTGLGGGKGHLVFGKSQPRGADGTPLPGAPDDMLRVVDTSTMSIAEIPYPPDYYTGERYGDWIQLVEPPDNPNAWMLEQYGDQYPLVVALFVDGAWTTDPAAIRNVVPIAATSPYGTGGEWSGVDPLGETVWTVPDRVAFWTEGPEWHEDGDVDLLSVCRRYDALPDGGSVCVSPSLLGVDGQSGTILWELPGHRQIQAVGDGYALIGDESENFSDGSPPGAWLMIDTATGQSIEGQAWSYETFETDYYSMEQIDQWVRRDGAAVLAVNGPHLRVWFPATASTPTISVSLAT